MSLINLMDEMAEVKMIRKVIQVLSLTNPSALFLIFMFYCEFENCTVIIESPKLDEKDFKLTDHGFSFLPIGSSSSGTRRI